MTGHAGLDSEVDVARLCRGKVTLVVFMGVGRRERIAGHLMGGGLATGTALAVTARACTPAERVVRATLGDLGSLEVMPPAVIVIGAVAAFGNLGVHELAEGPFA